MTPADRDRLASIQYLRAVAALLVVAFHVLGPAAVIGAAGVDVFFVISGFVIAMVTTGRRVDPLAFAYDRAARIVPLYWLFTAALVTAKAISPDLLPRLPLDAAWIVGSFLLVPVVPPGYTDSLPFLYQGWTLWYEMLFYAVVLAAIVVAPRRQATAIAAVLACLLAIGIVFAPAGPVWEVYTNPLLLEFLAGYGFGVWRQRGGRLSAGLGAGLCGIALAGFAVAAVFAGAPEHWPRIVWWGLPAAALVIGAVTLDDAGRIGRVRLLHLLGDASYSIYLSHGISISVLAVVWRRLGFASLHGFDQPLLALATFIAATIFGVAVHLLVEKPVMAFLRRMKPRILGAGAPDAAKAAPASASPALPSGDR